MQNDVRIVLPKIPSNTSISYLADLPNQTKIFGTFKRKYLIGYPFPWIQLLVYLNKIFTDFKNYVVLLGVGVGIYNVNPV